MGEAIATQDCRMTSHCIYVVRDENHKPVSGAVFLTRAGAEEYKNSEAHNLGEDAYVYVESGMESDEWKELRAACVAIYESTGGDRHKRRFSHTFSTRTCPDRTDKNVKLYHLPEVAKAWACECKVGDSETWAWSDVIHVITRTE